MDTDIAPATAGARLRAVTDLARALAGVHTLSEVVHVAAEESLAALGATAVSLSEYIRATGELRVLINHGDLLPWEQPFPEDDRYARTDFTGILSRQHPRPWIVTVDDDSATAGVTAAAADDAPTATAAAARDANVPSPPSTDVDPRRIAALRRRGRHSALIAPIFFAGQVWGELYAVRSVGDPPYGPDDVDFAATLAALISAGLAQADRQEYFKRLAYSDELTGLANRRAIEVGLDEGIDLHRLTGLPVALIVCDVNGLKRLNDTEGHGAGDAALECLGAQLSAAASGVEGALAARIGGDEFCVLTVGQPFSVISALADEIADWAATIPEIDGVSCGFAATDGPAGHVDSRDLLFRLADAAQYEAKRSAVRTPIVAGPEHRALVEASTLATSAPGSEPGTASPSGSASTLGNGRERERRKIRRPR